MQFSIALLKCAKPSLKKMASSRMEHTVCCSHLTCCQSRSSYCGEEQEVRKEDGVSCKKYNFPCIFSQNMMDLSGNTNWQAN